MKYRKSNIDIEKCNEIIQKCFFIVDKDRVRRPFVLNEVQKRLGREMVQRNIVLKARKEGCSSYILALFLAVCLYEENANAVIISDEKGATQRLLSRAYYYLDYMKPVKPMTERASRNEIYFSDRNNRLYIGAAGSKVFGRGDDVSHLHVSEYGFWEHPEMLTGLIEALIRDHTAIIETTANGVGNMFYRMWESAKRGTMDWKPIFIPWFENPEYSSVRSGSNVPADIAVSELDNMEEALYKQYRLNKKQLLWRRERITEMLDPALFPQEYPSNDVEAFISSGRKVFDSSKLQGMYEMRREPDRCGDLVRDKSGCIVINPSTKGLVKFYAMPEENRRYAIGCDTAGGSDYVEPGGTADKTAYSSASVKDRETWETVAVMNCKLEVDAFGDYINLLGRYYNNAILGVEDNNMGIAVIKHLQNICRYPNMFLRYTYDEATQRRTQKVGWHTDMKSKPIMIQDMNKAIRGGLVKINDEETIRQLLSYVYDKHNKARPETGAFADLVIAECIALQICQINPVKAEKEYVEKDNRIRSRGGSGYG